MFVYSSGKRAEPSCFAPFSWIWDARLRGKGVQSSQNTMAFESRWRLSWTR